MKRHATLRRMYNLANMSFVAIKCLSCLPKPLVAVEMK